MHEYTSRVKVWGLTCPSSPEEVARARRWTRDILRDTPCVDDAALIVSELGANALRHTASGGANGAFHVALALSGRVLAISVLDAGGVKETPTIRQPGPGAEDGRGLTMVSALATLVEIHGDHRGRTVTATMTIPSGDPSC
ncbi:MULTISPECIES: ATP-binding protein [Streptomycetaceae]|uniref:ATP-binding protein n=1 Tax=Streptomycetaceae TaxID=2062 RepID=UPI0005A27153|nr:MULTISPECIES: ATP-binding protein [Streptomycetaceae]